MRWRKSDLRLSQKTCRYFMAEARKAIGISMDMIELAPKLDTVVLVSGDGDFVPLVQHLQSALGARVEVMAFGKSGSSKLKEAANSFTDMDINPRKYLMK